jgi:Tol biopolymer transport system component
MPITCPHCHCLIDRRDDTASDNVLCPTCGSSFQLQENETAVWDPKAVATEPVRVETGQTVSHYRILEKLGSGGMGIVYRGQDVRLGRNVALKFVKEKYARSPLAVERFFREARTASELNHPHICTLHDIGDHAGQPFLVMELLEGQTLKHRIAGEPLPIREVLDLGVQIADALDAAHARGIVHRDIKPANIFVTTRGQAKILDFGLAKLDAEGRANADTDLEPSSSGNSDGELSSPGVVMGTAAYMSPEQARGAEVDQRSDLFSFGVVLFEMLTGRHPFPAPSPRSQVDVILHAVPTPPSSLNPECSAELDRVLLRTLAKNPEERYQSAGELRTDLMRILRASESGTRRLSASLAGSRRRNLLMSGIAAALLAIAVLALGRAAWLHFTEDDGNAGGDPGAIRPLIGDHRLRSVPLTTYPGEEFNSAFSPDGQRIAFIWNGEQDQNYDIYVLELQSRKLRRLTTHPDAEVGPTWSPDGTQIAFARFTGPQRDIFVVPAEGGEEQKLATASMGPPDPGSPLSWSPDGKLLAFTDRNSAEEPHGIFLFDLATSEKRRLTLPLDKKAYDAHPHFSPDGKSLAFSRSAARLEELWIVPLSGGEARQLTFDRREIRGLDWTPDGTELVFSSRRGGQYTLWRVPIQGGEPRSLGLTGENALGPSVARLGHRLVYGQRFEDRNIWRVELSPANAPTGPPTPLIVSTRDETLPQYSPDGQHIAFVSNRSGSSEIWRCTSEGGEPKPLTSFGGPQTSAPRWSPDGKRIAFETRASGNPDLYVVSVDGGELRQLTTDTTEETTPCWSRDGQWIYFTSNRSGENQIWKMPADGGTAMQVTREGGSAPCLSADGATLFFWKMRDRPGVWRMPVDGGPETQVHPDIRPHYWGSWTVSSAGIYFLHEETTEDHTRRATVKSSIRYFGFGTGTIRTLALQEKPCWSLALSPDGRSLLYAQFDQRGSDLMLVEGFR